MQDDADLPPRHRTGVNRADENQIVWTHEAKAWRPCKRSSRSIQVRPDRQRRERGAGAQKPLVTRVAQGVAAHVPAEPKLNTVDFFAPNHKAARRACGESSIWRLEIPTPTTHDRRRLERQGFDVNVTARYRRGRAPSTPTVAAVNDEAPFETVKNRLPIPSIAP